MDASGAMDCSSVWTFGGDGILPNMVKSVTETQVPTYDIVQHMTEELTRDVAAMPILPGVTTRVELPPLKPAKVTKPENVEGRPGTHWEDDDGNRVAPPEESAGEEPNTHDGGGNAGGGGPERRPGGSAPESSESDDDAESPFDDSWGGSNPESDSESSDEDAEEAPAQPRIRIVPNPSESGSRATRCSCGTRCPTVTGQRWMRSETSRRPLWLTSIPSGQAPGQRWGRRWTWRPCCGCCFPG